MYNKIEGFVMFTTEETLENLLMFLPDQDRGPKLAWLSRNPNYRDGHSFRDLIFEEVILHDIPEGQISKTKEEAKQLMSTTYSIEDVEKGTIELIGLGYVPTEMDDFYERRNKLYYYKANVKSSKVETKPKPKQKTKSKVKTEVIGTGTVETTEPKKKRMTKSIKELNELLKKHNVNYYTDKDLLKIAQDNDQIEITMKAYGDSKEEYIESFFSKDYKLVKKLADKNGIGLPETVWYD